MTKKTLSSKGIFVGGELIYHGKDIKQFIKEVLEEIGGIKTATYNWKFLDRAKKIIKQKAGDKLI